MPNPNRVVILGPMRSGKDSIAHALVKRYDFKQLSFATALKMEVATALSAVDGGSWDVERVDANKTLLRPLLQTWGADFRRVQNPNYWVEWVREAIETSVSLYPTRGLVVSDARFMNELDMLADKGFTFIALRMEPQMLRQHIRNLTGLEEQDVEKLLAHASENEWKGYPSHISLDSTPGCLNNLIDLAMKALGRDYGSD